MDKKNLTYQKEQAELLFLKQQIEYEVNEVREYIKCLVTEKADKIGATKELIKNCYTKNDRLGSVLDLLNDMVILIKRIKPLTEKEVDRYRDEYYQLRNDDNSFAIVWDDNEEDFRDWLQDNVIDVK